MSKRQQQREGIANVMDSLNKTYGDGTIMRMSDPGIKGVEAVSSGSLILNNALGIGGYPKGRILEVYGGESSGKTTISLHFLSQFGGNILFVDAEHALDKDYAKNLGVSVDSMIITQPDYIEQGLDIVNKMCEHVDAVVFDSIAGSPPLKELQGEITDQDVGVKAKLMSRATRMLNGKIAKSGCTVMFINQTRDNIGPLAFAGKVRPGGNAMKFHSSVSLDVRRAEGIKSGEVQIGHYMAVKVAKNKVAPPFVKCKIPILYGEGISTEIEVVDLGLELGLLKKSGSWFSYDGSNLGQGLANTVDMLKDNPDLTLEISKKIVDAGL